MSATMHPSRRGFVAGAASLAGASLTGTVAFASAEAPEAAQPIEEVYDCDIVVCGSGTAGLCGAWRAAELGAKVILVETHGVDGFGVYFIFF